MFTRGYLDVTSVAYKSSGINIYLMRFQVSICLDQLKALEGRQCGPKAYSNHDFFDVTGLCPMGYKALHGFGFQLSNAKNLVL